MAAQDSNMVPPISFARPPNRGQGIVPQIGGRCRFRGALFRFGGGGGTPSVVQCVEKFRAYGLRREPKWCEIKGNRSVA